LDLIEGIQAHFIVGGLRLFCDISLRYFFIESSSVGPVYSLNWRVDPERPARPSIKIA